LGDGSPVFNPVTGSNYKPVVWEDVVSNSSVKHKLKSGGLNCGGSEVDLV
jgi:predicted HAD superfamily Cof-like phosphohydrolase